MKKIIVAIDGYSSCGKSTIAKALARYAGYKYIDTGAMYRAVGLYCLNHGLMDKETINEDGVRQIIDSLAIGFSLQADGSQHTMLNGEDVENKIRTLEIGDAASRISTIGFVRQALVRQQQRMGDEKGIVMDGRDIGTVVFPKAELKLFLTARPEVRAQRRFLELQQKGQSADFEQVLKETNERDYRDTHRKESPLRQADDAILFDNSELTEEGQMKQIIEIFEKRIAQL
ncbi:MAG: (d)CMP kinase [Paludibacteraceae bacterium]|nr:(d)CMP kinase [Paludibacteraceae bacterium]